MRTTIIRTTFHTMFLLSTLVGCGQGGGVGVPIGFAPLRHTNVAVAVDKLATTDLIAPEWGISVPNMGGTIDHAIGKVTEPIKHAVTDPIANALGGLGRSAINKMAGMIADNPEVKRQSGGWTIYTCAATGGTLFYSLQAVYSVPVCAALSVASGDCVAFIMSSGSAITTATCATLCQRHQLSGPECQ